MERRTIIATAISVALVSTSAAAVAAVNAGAFRPDVPITEPVAVSAPAEPSAVATPESPQPVEVETVYIDVTDPAPKQAAPAPRQVAPAPQQPAGEPASTLVAAQPATPAPSYDDGGYDDDAYEHESESEHPEEHESEDHEEYEHGGEWDD